MFPAPLTLVDVETTGTNPRFDRIIEVGVLRVENNEIVSSFSSLVNPHTYIPAEITRITGITSNDVLSAPDFSEIKKQLHALFEGAILVAHNARFDYGFLKHEFARHEMPFSAKQLCTVRLARALFPELPRHNLDALITHFNLPCEKRHRALDDTKAMYHFLGHAVQKKAFPETLKKLLKKASVPIHLTASDLETLPESPGVYLMYGENDLPLYIGKSKNIKDRILSHFGDDLNSQTEMKISQQVTRIAHVSTAGELGALFLESKLIKQMLPLYNKRLRNSRKMILLKKEVDENGYERIVREPFINGESLGDVQSVVGICKSEREAKEFLYGVAKDYSLCPKLLGLEKASKDCFYNRLGYCSGACMQKEASLRYNMRMITAFSSSKITPWPFSGSIAIEEKSIHSLSEYILVDNWCFIGSIKVDAEGNKREERTTLGFDVDTYKILRSFLKNKHAGVRILPLSNEVIKQMVSPTLLQ